MEKIPPDIPEAMQMVLSHEAEESPLWIFNDSQTIRNIKTRIKEHKNYICKFKQNTQTDTVVARHFNLVKQLKWVVLEILQPLNRRGNFKQMLHREANWILKLNALAPKGLNKAWSVKCFLCVVLIYEFFL
ncbi:hypothetical protein XELAEV_18027600mg [Xenopus laevis]|uniref:Uncharacterized protein n=1 Tax=Xenopus laevis TaxID=8355 RepID=A0A974CY00_XENLA|nr:hypothetical protein XELAEV_18027600mg [Xenopus laevis]